MSAKIWRYAGEKWSRQSEEMPLHRVLDLAILVCKAKTYCHEAYRYPKLYDENNTTIDRIALQGGELDVSVCTGNERLNEDIVLLRDALGKDDELLSERLHRLSAMLREMGF